MSDDYAVFSPSDRSLNRLRMCGTVYSTPRLGLCRCSALPGLLLYSHRVACLLDPHAVAALRVAGLAAQPAADFELDPSLFDYPLQGC